jgi:hypothetical protein
VQSFDVFKARAHDVDSINLNCGGHSKEFVWIRAVSSHKETETFSFAATRIIDPIKGNRRRGPRPFPKLPQKILWGNKKNSEARRAWQIWRSHSRYKTLCWIEIFYAGQPAYTRGLPHANIFSSHSKKSDSSIAS